MELLPSEITTEILSRLPVKSIVTCRSVSKPWLSYISDPSFTRLHRTTAFFFSAFDYSTGKNHLFSASAEQPLLTLLTTLDDAGFISEPQHLNGLVCFTLTHFAYARAHADAFLFNPSTHSFFKLPHPHCSIKYDIKTGYFFGFDESTNDYKILMITVTNLRKAQTAQIMIYSLSKHSWTTVFVEPPIIGYTWDRLGKGTKPNVCVNSVVYIGVDRRGRAYDILAFDLTTHKFSIISNPEGLAVSRYYRPRIIKIKGRLGVVCYNRMRETNEMYFWILQNDGVWVREIITFPESWTELAGPPLEPVDVNNMDEIIFYNSKVSGNVTSLPIYDKKRRCFNSLQFTLPHQFLCSKTLSLRQIKFYVESMVSVTNTTHISPQAQPKRTPACFTESTLKRKWGDSMYPRGNINNSDQVVTMKAKFGSDNIKFLLPIQEVGLAAIDTQVRKRFAGMGSFYKVKYLDPEDAEWYLLALDEDIQGHIKRLKSNKKVVKIIIESTQGGASV